MKISKKDLQKMVIDLLERHTILAIKTSKVKVHRAKKGEKIQTILKNGLIETPRIHRCAGDEWVITNLTGEVYFIENTKEFQERYSYDGGDFAFPISRIRKLVEVPKEYLPIRFPAPWGGEMILADGFLNYDDIDKIYAVAREEFFKTHELLIQQR